MEKRIIFFAFTLSVFLAGCGPFDISGRQEEVQQAFAARDFNRAGRICSEIIEHDAANVDAMYMLARVCFEQGDLPGAQSWHARASELAPSDCDIAAFGAQIAYHLKDYAKAEKTFIAISSDASLGKAIRSQAFTGLGIVYMTQNLRDEARVAFLSALLLDRKRNPSAYYHLGLLYRDAFAFPEAAREQFEIFVRLAATPREKAEKVQRNILPAINDSIARAAAEIPNSSSRDSQAAAAALEKAQAAQKKGHYKTALLRYTDAEKFDALSFPASLGRARMLARDRSKAGMKIALKQYCKAVELKPNSVSTLLEAGKLALDADNPMTAERLYSMAVAANPLKLDSIDGLIRAHRKISRNSSKARLYQKYRDML